MKASAKTSVASSARKSISERNNVDVVLLAMYLLGGHLKTIDTEDVAVKAHELSPGRFSWRKYKDQIDIERVRVRLSGASHDGKLSGVHSRGWRLTAVGTRYVQETLLDLPLGDGPKVSIGLADRSWISSERKRLLSTQLYKRFAAGALKNVTLVELGEFFRVDEYMSSEIRGRKKDRIISAFRGDKILGDLLIALERQLEEKESAS